ncbi:uncharacterized protein DS421_15g519030 [Arachis hypogaea]|nr:uncharacterized protein DS421_15g519030 [Arachis hypogaea]
MPRRGERERDRAEGERFAPPAASAGGIAAVRVSCRCQLRAELPWLSPLKPSPSLPLELVTGREEAGFGSSECWNCRRCSVSMGPLITLLCLPGVVTEAVGPAGVAPSILIIVGVSAALIARSDVTAVRTDARV